ncbi:hypothetical protein HMPREF0762_01995 [Slackia exigua ATCC 700122]|uniref:Uncharacterized protein n=1 Tax=Slackia exigua (strain ATCC 700122 / DSM 15923 / CIP 105133 / JCM 11022 / KCTC 5966 / S-7) TaxID=649764 RepID=D0WJG8_SLAES|nr:hypothetical protein HMPREF0762_01995 [Slackia exigua ATCC 700122]
MLQKDAASTLDLSSIEAAFDRSTGSGAHREKTRCGIARI